MNLFVYGELTRAAVLRRVVGRLPRSRVAALAGFSRRRDMATGHFKAVPAAAAEIAGLVLLDLSRSEVSSIDDYEGVADGEYARRRVIVEVLEPEGRLAAEVYVAGGA